MRRPLGVLLVSLSSLAVTGCPEHDPCSVANQKTATLELMKSMYLYPDLLVPVDPDDPRYTSLSDYLDALTANARAQQPSLDRWWTYATTVSAQTAYYVEGEATGFGIGILDRDHRVFVSQVFGGSAADVAGFKRGDEILAIGESAATLVDVPTLIAGATTEDEELARISTAFGPSTAGLTRSIEVLPVGTSDPAADAVLRSPVKATYSLDPVPEGWTVMTGAGLPPTGVGYVALRMFITPAEKLLREVFAQFKTAGVRHVIVDLRYNGGGSLGTANVLSELLGGARSTTDVMYELQYNSSFSPEVEPFAAEPDAVSPLRVAFITTAGSASASELVPNVLEAYLHGDVGLVGKHTYGKPVGQIPFPLYQCEDTVVAVVAFRLTNAEGDGGYYGGLPDAAAGFSGGFCDAADDLTHATWDPAEASTAAALTWLTTGTCPPAAAPAQAKLSSGTTSLKAGTAAPDAYPVSPWPDEAQRNVRGLF